MKPLCDSYSKWSDAEKENNILARGRLLAELGLTESTFSGVVSCWEQSIHNGISPNELKGLALQSNNSLAAQVWVEHFNWDKEIEPNLPTVHTEISHDTDKPQPPDSLSYPWMTPPAPHAELSELETKLFENDADEVLKVLLESGFWSDDSTLASKDLWKSNQQGLVWWSSALHHGAVRCAELAWPGLISKATQEDLDRALMTVMVSQMHHACIHTEKDSDAKSKNAPFQSPLHPVSPGIAATWVTRLLDLGANPMRLFEIDGGIDERLYPDTCTDFTPRSSGVYDSNAPYCAAHIAIHLMVWNDRIGGRLKDVLAAFLPHIDAEEIPPDAWYRDPVSQVLSTVPFLFHKPSYISSCVGQNALEWLEQNLKVWGSTKSWEEGGWNPAFSLLLWGIREPKSQEWVNKFLENKPTILISWDDLQKELKNGLVKKLQTNQGMINLGEISDSWIFKEEGLLEKFADHLKPEASHVWLECIEKSRSQLLEVFKNEKTNNSSVYSPTQELVQLRETALEAHSLRWAILTQTPEPIKESLPKVRL